MSALFLKLARTVLLPLSPHDEVAQVIPVVRLSTKKLLVSVDSVVGLELLATTFSGKHIATVLPNCLLVKPLQRHEIFVTDITGVNPLSLTCLVIPH